MRSYNIAKAALELKVTDLAATPLPYLYHGLYEERPVILKYIEENRAFFLEKQTLSLFVSEACVPLLASDDKNQVLVLEKLVPGTTLKEVTDEHKASQIFSHIIKFLPKLSEPGLIYPTLEQWLSVIPHHSLLDKKHQNKAELILKKLSAIPRNTYLLHGDLHHENILESHRGWICLDPKGVIGPMEFETALYLLNPLDQKPCLDRFFNKVADLQRELGADPTLMKGYAFLRSLLGAIWAAEDQRPTESWLAWSELLQDCIE
jgi:streptomycin 6-kinase